MDVIDAIRTRRSHRAFKDDAVEPGKIEMILDAGLWAPSPANNQPWEFVVVTKAETRSKIVELAERSGRSGTIEVQGYSYIRPVNMGVAEPAGEDAISGYSVLFLKKVPVMIGVVGDPQPSVIQAGRERIRDGYKYACAAAIQNMLLAAHAQGLGSLWFTFFDRDLVASLLSIDKTKHLLAIVCIGYPSSTPRSPGRDSQTSKIRRID